MFTFFFVKYFGLLVILIGLVILKRTLTVSDMPYLHPDEAAAAKGPRRHLVVFSLLVNTIKSV